ncbi:MAG TPA: M1 family aminopeptidase [Verrucomicrobiae bacterium]|nr:M1 family aminopeptidase [Verrucomicrobiae bacterium]
MPLTEGYRIVKESREVRFVIGQPPELRIRARYTLENSGNGDLDIVDVSFPDERFFGRKHLRVEVDGREATPANPPPGYRQEAARSTFRIPFDPPWTRKQSRELLIEYSLSSPEDSGARITVSEDSFHLGSRGWSPRPEPPNHPFAGYPSRPDRTIFSVRVPERFRLLARGTLARRVRSGDEIEYRFELRKQDLPPFVAAGRYVESSSKHTSGDGVFWTLEPLAQDPSGAVAQITAVWNVLQTDFGPLDRNIGAPHVLEAPGLHEHITGEAGPAAAPFPGGALINPAALALGLDSDEFLERVTHALAHDWFGDQIFAAPDAALGMGEGLPEYATIVVETARKGDAGRRRLVAEYLREYDEARRRATETPLAITMMSDPPEERRIALAKAPLFYVALEDACGPRQMRDGLQHLVTLLRGQQANYSSLRSALEQSSGRDLAKLFRVWLNDMDVPQDFRRRYEGAAGIAEK